ncbi:hypothetical protein ACQJBY_034250 [Aegilops geniculata]
MALGRPLHSNHPQQQQQQQRSPRHRRETTHNQITERSSDIHRSVDEHDGTWVAVRRVQVLEAQVRPGVRVRALLLPRAGRGALRRHPQGVRRQQRLQAPGAPAHLRPRRGRRHRLLRGAGPAARPRLRLRRTHLRAPAAGHDPAGAARLAQGARPAGAARDAAPGGRQGLRGRRRGGSVRARRLPMAQRQRRGRGGCAAAVRVRRQRWRHGRARLHQRAAGRVGGLGLHDVPRARAVGVGRRRACRGGGLRGGGAVVVRDGGERVEVVVGVPRLRGPAERGVCVPKSLVRTTTTS